MKKETPFSIGIDIGTHSIKAILVDWRGEQPAIDHYLRLLVSDSGEAFSQAEMIELVQANFKDWAQKNASIHMSLSSKDVIVRYIEMPKMNEAELKNSLEYEAERYLPFKLADAYFDTHVLLEDVPDSEGKMWIVLVAAKKTMIDKKVEILSEAGIHLNSVDVGPIALVNAFETFSTQENVKKGILLLDVGAASSSINIISEGVPFLTREADFSGNAITKAFMKVLDKKFVEVEKMKFEEEMKWEAGALRLINAYIKSVKASIDYFEGKSEKTIDSVFLSGGSAVMPGFIELLSSELGKPVEKLTFASRLDRSRLSNSADFDENAHEFNVALGLIVKGKAE